MASTQDFKHSALNNSLPVRPESGRILIDGIDISKVNTQALRNRVVSLVI